MLNNISFKIGISSFHQSEFEFLFGRPRPRPRPLPRPPPPLPPRRLPNDDCLDSPRPRAEFK